MKKNNLGNMRTILALAVGIIIMHCHSAIAFDGPGGDKGFGPINEIKLEELKQDLAAQGKIHFNTKCASCHKMSERYVGPALKDITKKRKPEWIMNMIMNPMEMTQKDPAAQELLAEFLTQMSFQNVSEPETRAILEYFRYFDEKGELSDAVAKEAAKKEKKKKK